MGDAETSTSGRLSDEEAQRVWHVVRGWTESERQKLLLRADGDGLRRRSIVISALSWSLFATVSQILSVFVWLDRAPFDISLSPSLAMIVLLGLWIFQGSLGVRAYGVLSVDGGLRDWPVPVEVTALLTIAGVGTYAAHRYWSDRVSSGGLVERQKLISLWAWYLPIIGPFWAYWQLCQEGGVVASSRLVRRSYETLTAASARALWKKARETLILDWQKKGTVGRWLGWRDRSDGVRQPSQEAVRFRRLCQDQCTLVLPGAMLLGWEWGKTGHPWWRFLDPGSGEWFLGLVGICGGLSLVGAAGGERGSRCAAREERHRRRALNR